MSADGDVGQQTLEERFGHAESSYGLLFDYNPIPMWLYDMGSLRFLRVNEAAIQHYGYSTRQFLSMSILDLQAPEHDAPTLDAGADPEGTGCAGGDRLLRRRDGALIEVELLTERVVFRGRAAGLVLAQPRRVRGERTARQIDHVWSMSKQLRAMSARCGSREELFKASCRIAVKRGGFRVALIADVTPQSQRLELLASSSDSEARLAEVEHLVSAPDERLAELIAQVIRQGRVQVGAWSGDAYGAIALLPLVVSGELVAVMLLGGGSGEDLQGDMLRQLTELAEDLSFSLDYLCKAKQLHHLRHYDSVTGLANRSLFLERTERGLRELEDGGRGLALCIFDLERFKHVNDCLGQAAGDALLRQVGTWMTRRVGDPNRVARVGVDHFAVLLPGVADDGSVLEMVEKMLADFARQPFRFQGSMLRMSAKAGIACSPEDGGDAESLYRHAEDALKQAKHRGELSLRYCRQMSEAVAERVDLESRLRLALERGEFLLHYQPKLSLLSGRLVGIEALIRWQDPREGLVSPARFIPVIEDSGLIHEVGAWAIRQAMLDSKRWREQGLPAVRIAVNVSPRQLRNPAFVPLVWRILAAAQQSAADLELEITESVIMDGIQQNIAVLQAIREMGVQIAIDDFGTGFSSLSYLARLPVDTLKIDRSFVVDMTTGPEGLSLVSTIIHLAHSLKLKVVAEGVETAEQARLLRLLSCDEAQGFLYSRPIPAETLETTFLRASPLDVSQWVQGGN